MLENGREDAPKRKRLERFLDCYGVTLQTFLKHVKDFEEEETDEDVIKELLKRLNKKDVKALRVLAEHLAGVY